MNDNFKTAVLELVKQIPVGKVMTYGDIADYCGHPRAARQVGGIAHYGPQDLPWHRVVNRNGDCASGYYGGKDGHKQVLQQEGFTVVEYRIVDFEERRWRPSL